MNVSWRTQSGLWRRYWIRTDHKACEKYNFHRAGNFLFLFFFFLQEGNSLVDLLLKLWKQKSFIGHILTFKRSAFPCNGCVICVKK